MAVTLRHQQQHVGVEPRILIGMIVSTEYLRKARNKFKLDYFQQEYTHLLCGWILEYFDKYEKSPGQNVETIFSIGSDSLKPADKELLTRFLESLSTQYEQGDTFNVQYLLDETDRYFADRSMHMHAERILALMDSNKALLAEKEIADYKGVPREVSGWCDVLSDAFAAEVYEKWLFPESGENANFLFRLPGAVGELIGGFERDWLFSILAPRKRGKSFFLQELAKHAVLAKLNTIFISLEMMQLGEGGRFLQGITAAGKESLLVYPVFDCQRNQDGSCVLRKRMNYYTLIIGENKPLFDPGNPYRACTECRDEKNGPFKVATWREQSKRPVFTNTKFRKETSIWRKRFGSNLKLRSYPMSTTTMSQLIGDINALEFSENFVPDVIIIDYADIIGPEDGYEGLAATDKTWQMLKNLAEVKHCLVLTATQGNRKSGETKDVKANQVSWDIRKNDHVDGQIALSQTPDEKKEGLVRVSKTLSRWGEFDETKSIKVLQDLSRGQVILDSY